VVLLDHVVEVLDPNHLDWDRAAEGHQHSVDRVDTRSVGAAPVDAYLAGQAVQHQRPHKVGPAPVSFWSFESDTRHLRPPVRWRLWNGQTDRANDLIDRLFHDLKADEQGNSVVGPLRSGLLNLRTYIEQNRGSITNYGARYREGKRIASTAAEASVNNLVARRMVKKQQMRWSEGGAYLLLQVRVAIANGDLADRLAYQPPIQPGQTLISPFVPVPIFQRAA
jgi:hypothetical protein